MTRELRIKLNSIRQEAGTILRQYLEKHGCGDIHNAEKDHYELPRTFHVDRYGYYNEYAILGVRCEGHMLIFDAFGVGEGNYGHDMAFYDYELETETILLVAQELETILTNTKTKHNETV